MELGKRLDFFSKKITWSLNNHVFILIFEKWIIDAKESQGAVSLY